MLHIFYGYLCSISYDYFLGGFIGKCGHHSSLKDTRDNVVVFKVLYYIFLRGFVGKRGFFLSCSTSALSFGLHSLCEKIGHSSKIEVKHFLALTACLYAAKLMRHPHLQGQATLLLKILQPCG